MVEVQGSEIEDAAEGLFALQDIETNTVVAFYNGTVANMEDYDPDTWETNCYKIFDPADMPDGTIDIPVWAQVRPGRGGAKLLAFLKINTQDVEILSSCHFLYRAPLSTAPPLLTRPITAFCPTPSSWCLSTPSTASSPASPPSQTSPRGRRCGKN